MQTGHELLSIPDKTLVITGALSPARLRGSHAEFNIGSAIGAVRSLPARVYIGINERIRDPAKVLKSCGGESVCGGLTPTGWWMPR